MARDFGALGGWGTNREQTELTTLRIAAEEHRHHKNVAEEWDAYIERSTVTIECQTNAHNGRTSSANDLSTEPKPATHSMSVSIPHSSKDAELALALIDLLKAALALTADDFRCSSVDGYRLPIGVNTEGKLREEITRQTVLGFNPVCLRIT